jgi:hypothetical protein
MRREVAAPAPLEPELCGLPAIWNRLTSDDHSEYFRFRSEFRKAQRPIGESNRIVGFQKDLLTALSFIDRRHECAEERSVICGIAFAGPYMCVNMWQLKIFLGRCKSSINGSFMEIGYTALKAKSKAKSCILACLRILIDNTTNLRQWTVRCASCSARFCVYSSFSVREPPEIDESEVTQIQKEPLPKNVSVWIPELEMRSCFEGIDLITDWELPLDSVLQGDFGGGLGPDVLGVFDEFHAD